MKNLKSPAGLLVLISGLLAVTLALLQPRLPRSSSKNGNNLSALAVDKSTSSEIPAAAPIQSTVSPETRARIDNAYARLPMQFEENQGQFASAVRFVSRGSGYTLFLTPTEAVLSVVRRAKSTVTKKGPGLAHRPAAREAATIRMEMVGGNRSAKITGVDELPGKSNYFIGNDPKKWRTDVSAYQRVNYRAVYPGIDLVYYGNQRQLEYDFIVAPHADASLIRLRFNGAEQLRINESGDLVIKTETGEELRQNKPVIYQERDGTRQSIAGNYVLLGRSEVGFEVTTYDQSRPLVIDPTLGYATYLGGVGSESAVDIAVDSSGNAYVVGSTTSSNFPIVNPRQSFLGGNSDVFVAKLNSTGSALTYSTYLGGSLDDIPASVAINSAGNAFVTGYSDSSNFPTFSARQANRLGSRDAFVFELGTTGNTLVYSTYHGGSSDDVGAGIAVDSSGSAYVVGSTSSTNFPTASPKQASSGGLQDVFVTKFSSTGLVLTYSTYLGGADFDSGSGIAIDLSGNAYITGTTSSTNFPTASPRQAASGGLQDVFVAKLNAAGSALVYSTYHGGSDYDSAGGIALDASNNVYITGRTGSTNFPTAGAIQPTSGGGNDAFVTKFNAAGSALVYSTYLGGSGLDSGVDIAVDSSGNASVVGWTYSSPNFPMANALQSIPSDSNYYESFVTKLNAAGNGFLYSTYLGGAGYDSAYGVASNATGTYVVGGAEGFPVTPGALQTTTGGSTDAFIARIIEGTNPTYFTIRGHLQYANGKSVIGAAIQLSGSQTKSTTTSSNGNYVFQLLTNGSYTVTPQAVLVTTPTQRVYPSLTGNQPSADFVSNQTFTISGRVLNVNLRGLSGVRVDLSGDAALTTQTDSNGRYSFSVPASGSYTVGPNDLRVSNWLPQNTRDHLNLSQDFTNDDFTAQFPSFTVAGTIKTASGANVTNLANVMRLSGGASANYPTDPNGRYTSDQLNVLGDYTFTPQPFTFGGLTYNTFSPSNMSFVSILTCDPQSFLCSGFSYTNIDFTAIPAPKAVTSAASAVAVTTATLNGIVNPNGIATTRWFEWGTDSTLTTNNATSSVSVGTQTTDQPISANLTNLSGGTTYYFRAVAMSSGGTVRGSILNFTTTPVPRTLTLASTNPGGGVSITVSPNDNNGAGNGVTQFTRTYNNNQVVNLTAPATAGGNNFQKWLKDGADFANNANANVNVTMDANHTMTAVYLTPTKTLTVASSNSGGGVDITVSPNDNNGTGNGTTQFTRIYSVNQVVSLTAPATAGGNNFQKWLKDGADFANNTALNVNVTMDADHTMTAVYLTPTKTITVASTNPAAGVSITVSPNDNNSAGNGMTQFTRTYNNNQVVSLTAPAMASGNNFQKWLKDGADFANNTNANVNITMDADHTMTAVYLTPPDNVALGQSSYSVAENAGSLTITVMRSGSLGGAFTVNYATSDAAGANKCDVKTGAASSRCDYETTVGTLSFAVGEASKTIKILIMDDSYGEENENLTFSLSSPVGAILGTPSSATVTITDNETVNGPNPINDARYFVRVHYTDFLNREPDSGGWDFWTNQITTCGSNVGCTEVARINVSASFFLSIEFQQTGYLVERVYKTAYGDVQGASTFPTPHQLPVPVVRFNEFLADTQQITRGVVVLAPGWEALLESNKVAFFADFVQRSRFTTALPTSMTPAEFVDALNQRAGNVLSAAERTTAINLFGGVGNTMNAAARAQALRQVAEDPDLFSAESNRAFVLMQYFGFLRRNPDDPQDTDYTGYDFWLTKLNQFGGNYINAEMVKAFITSTEYQRRFGP